jgi:DNA repair exonuclease SbcCD ATPase subunit
MNDNADPFADLEYRMNNSNNKINEVINRNSNINLAAKQPVSKAVQLKAENYDLWFQNERLSEDNALLSGELTKLQDKHDKLMYLARNRLGEIKNKYVSLEQDNMALRNELDKLIREYENCKKLIDEYRRLEEKFKATDHDMRVMIDQLTRNNEELKGQNQGLLSEVELLREKYFVAKQNLEKAIRDGSLMKDELTKAMFAKDALEKELARAGLKISESAVARKAAEDKIEFLNNKAQASSLDLRKSEANAAMLHERFTLLKAEKEALETDSRAKIQQMLLKLKELQAQNKTFIEQMRMQSKQCDNLNEENKQLLTYINGYRAENDLLAQQLANVNGKQKRLALELEKLKNDEQFQRNEEAIKMNEAVMGLTNELNSLRKMHANVLSENQRIKEMLIEKDSVLGSLGYERHQLQDRMIKNQHTITQLERMLRDNQKPFIAGVNVPSSGENIVRTYEPVTLPEI